MPGTCGVADCRVCPRTEPDADADHCERCFARFTDRGQADTDFGDVICQTCADVDLTLHACAVADCATLTRNRPVLGIDPGMRRVRMCSACRDDPQVCHSCRQRFTSSDGLRCLEPLYAGVSTPLRVCDDCADDFYTQCASCDDWGLRDGMYTDDYGDAYCESCRPIYEEDDEWCSECEEYHSPCSEDGGGPIESYYYKPPPRFRHDPADASDSGGPGLAYLGMELEIEAAFTGADPGAGASVLAEYDPSQQRWYMKHDGSLSRGFEFVTHPATLTAHMKGLPWEAFEQLRREGFRSYSTDTCGMHVHVSRDAFDSPHGEASPHLWRFLAFHHRNVPQVTKVAGRNSDHWASWTVTERHSKIEYAKSKGKANAARYVAINLQNHSTVELRYFRGTLSAYGIRKNLEFADAVTRYTQRLTFAQVRDGALEWPAFRKWLTGDEARAERYKNLIAFCERKGL